MFARKGRYAAAYTHREPSRDDELRQLLQWISEQPGSRLLFVGPDVRAIDNSALANGLVKGGTAHYTTWKKKDWWQQERDQRTSGRLRGRHPHGLGPKDK